MRNLKKVLSILLTMVLVFGTMSIGAEAAYYAYKDSAITDFDSIDKPIFSTEQYESMLMDEVDRMLGQANIQINEDLAGLLTISLNLSSVDSALNSVVSLWNTVSSMATTIGGDVRYLDFSALTSCPRRATAGTTDGDILLALFQFLADNADIISKLPYGSVANGGIDLGILAGFVDISEFLDIPLLVKGMVADLLYPDYEENPPYEGFSPTDLTLDGYIETFISNVVTGEFSTKYPDKSDTINEIAAFCQHFLPGVIGTANDYAANPNNPNKIFITHDSVYNVVEKCIRIAISSNQLVGLLNTFVGKVIREACGIKYTEIVDEDGEPVLDAYGFPTYTQDASDRNSYENILNINFALEPFDLSGWGSITTDTFINHLNEILGQIVEEVLNPNVTITWNYANGNAALLTNVVNAAKVILGTTGKQFFPAYIHIYSQADLNAMSNEQVICYLARAILNGSIDDINIPDSCDTIPEVLFEGVKAWAANVVPSRDYSALTPDMDGVYTMLADIAVYGLNQSTNMDLSYGISLDDLVDEAMNWVETNYGGFVSDISGTSGWDKLNTLIFSIFPSDWLPNDQNGTPREDVYSILFDDVIEKVLDLNVDAILDLVQRNTNSDADLNGTIMEVLLGRIVAIVNYVIPDTFDTGTYSYNTLESILSPALLSSFINNLFVGLNDRAADIMPSLLPLLCSMLGLSSPEEFGYPYVSLPETLNFTTTKTFYMFNGSSGINTAFTNKNGVTTRDQLYKYAITSIETNQSGVTITPAATVANPIVVNGGESKTFTINGTPADNSVLRVIITYNVYEETGAVMTTTPLKAISYSYVSTEKDDGDNKSKYDTPASNTHLVYATAKYINQNGSVQALNDVTFTLQRNGASNATQHLSDATFSLTSATVDPSLALNGVSTTPLNAIATTKAGGAWPYQAFTVDESATRPDDGLYSSRYIFFATKTNSATETIAFDYYVYFYNDFNLPSLFNSSVKSNRQQANYNQGSYTVSYTDFYAAADEDETNDIVSETVTGSTVWIQYLSALNAAAAIVNRPRLINTFDVTHASLYEEAAYNLYTAIQRLEGGSLSSGASQVKTTLESFVPATATKLNEEGKEVDVEYYETGYTFFGREDYVGYTYSNFGNERDSAEDLIEKWENDEDIDTIEAAYVNHRLSLYGNRLIRVRAYTTHLAEVLAVANTIAAGHYDSETWADFLTARTFANSVASEAIGTTVSGTDYLVGDGLRQSKVNTARSELIYTMKKLVSSVDYTQLNEIYDIAKPIYELGNDDGIYTAISWTAFAQAFRDARDARDAKYEWSEANQAIVDAAATALNDAYEALETTALPDIEPVPPESGESLILRKIPDITSSVDGNPVNFMYGINMDDPAIDGKFETVGNAYTEPDNTYNSTGATGTGTRLMVYMDVNDGTGTKKTYVKSYWIVIFGDINGDGLIESTDYSMLVDASQYGYDWACYSTEDNPWMFASDLNHDGMAESTDLSIMLDSNEYWYMLNQYWDGTTGGDYRVDYT